MYILSIIECSGDNLGIDNMPFNELSAAKDELLDIERRVREYYADQLDVCSFDRIVEARSNESLVIRAVITEHRGYFTRN